ncbi:histone-lysine N-methyltransferase SETMAR-like [Trichonephila clavipes]|uniref:Histone-lysine N-methyltransferase SETMAR-like n=1 Tax=Trichonephila clavipes TaxID=2585209 RepID=A0A8X6W2G4_TRICX|nr:histone-lysine N-methyltransferase SETMAR-like [Trichonephila clavipes]
MKQQVNAQDTDTPLGVESDHAHEFGKKGIGLLRSGILLLDAIARPHLKTAMQNHIAILGWEPLHHPPYSPDLAPSTFHLPEGFLEAMQKSNKPLNVFSAVGSLVVRASDSRPEGLGSMPDATKHSPSLHGVEIEVVSPSIVPSRNFVELNRTVTCMVLKANDRRTSCPCHDEFRGPRSDCVRQFRRFRLGILDVIDAPRKGRPVVENVDKITEISKVAQHVSSRSIVQELKMYYKTVLNHLRKVGFKNKPDWLPYGQTLNPDLYCQQLNHLKLAIDQKWLELTKKRGVVFHQDSVRSRMSLVTRQNIWELGWEVLMHPSYSLDWHQAITAFFFHCNASLVIRNWDQEKIVKINL